MIGHDGAVLPALGVLSAALGEVCDAALACLALTLAELECAHALAGAVHAEIVRRAVLQ